MKLDRLKMHQEWFDRNQHLMFLESRIIMQELLAMTREARNQRDEARILACKGLALEARHTMDKIGSNIWKKTALTPQEMAEERGWDCFKENGNV
jgi:hypothetical protein